MHMLDNRLITELKAIAFNETEKPSDIVSACGILAKNSIELDNVISVLNGIALDAVVPSKVRIKAIDMLDKVMVKAMEKEPQETVAKEEEDYITNTLLKEYGLG